MLCLALTKTLPLVWLWSCWQDLSDVTAGLDTEEASMARWFARVFATFVSLE